MTFLRSVLGAVLYTILFLLMLFGTLWLMIVLDPGYFLNWFI